jgi:hypothetical protein
MPNIGLVELALILLGVAFGGSATVVEADRRAEIPRPSGPA